MTDYAPFNGDGREVIDPFSSRVQFPVYPPAVRVQVAQAREMIDAFVARRESHHSRDAQTLWVLMHWCEHHDLSYYFKVGDELVSLYLESNDLPL